MPMAMDLPVTLFVSPPGAPTVAPHVAGGGKAWGYEIYAEDARGNLTALSVEGTTADGANALDAGHYNHVTWTDPANAVRIHVFRSTVPGGGSTPTTTGAIGVVNAGVQVFDDTGQAGDGSTGPTANGTGVGAAVDVWILREKWAQASGAWDGPLVIEGSIDDAGTFVPIATIGAPGMVEVRPRAKFLRVRQVDFVSGTPRVKVGGLIPGDL